MFAIIMYEVLGFREFLRQLGKWRHHYDKNRLLAPKTRSSLKIIHHEYHLIIPNICIIIKSQVLLLCVEGEKVFDDDDDEVYQQL